MATFQRRAAVQQCLLCATVTMFRLGSANSAGIVYIFLRVFAWTPTAKIMMKVNWNAWNVKVVFCHLQKMVLVKGLIPTVKLLKSKQYKKSFAKNATLGILLEIKVVVLLYQRTALRVIFLMKVVPNVIMAILLIFKDCAHFYQITVWRQARQELALNVHLSMLLARQEPVRRWWKLRDAR